MSRNTPSSVSRYPEPAGPGDLEGTLASHARTYCITLIPGEGYFLVAGKAPWSFVRAWRGRSSERRIQFAIGGRWRAGSSSSSSSSVVTQGYGSAMTTFVSRSAAGRDWIGLAGH